MLVVVLACAAVSASPTSAAVEKLMKQKGKSDASKWANLAKFLAPGSEIRTDTDRINFKKMLLEAKGMSPERAESMAALKSLKEVETKMRLEKFMKRAFRKMMQALYLKMKARVDARKAFVREHQMSSNVRVAAEIKKRWGATGAARKARGQARQRQRA